MRYMCMLALLMAVGCVPVAEDMLCTNLESTGFDSVEYTTVYKYESGWQSNLLRVAFTEEDHVRLSLGLAAASEDDSGAVLVSWGVERSTKTVEDTQYLLTSVDFFRFKGPIIVRIGGTWAVEFGPIPMKNELHGMVGAGIRF